MPLIDSSSGVGIRTEYTHCDYLHPLSVITEILRGDINLGDIGTSTTYSRADHYHQLNADPIVANKPVNDSESRAIDNYIY